MSLRDAKHAMKANAEALGETLLLRKCSTAGISFLLYQMMHVDLIIV